MPRARKKWWQMLRGPRGHRGLPGPTGNPGPVDEEFLSAVNDAIVMLKDLKGRVAELERKLGGSQK